MYANSKELARRIFAQLYPEGYPEKLWRLTRSPESRIMSTHHQGPHKTTYILGLATKQGPILFPVECRTLSMMNYDGGTA